MWLAFPIIVMTAMTFAALGAWLCAQGKSFDHFNYLWGFYIAPAFIVTGIFFPADSLPVWIRMAGITWMFWRLGVQALSKRLIT